MTDITDLLNEWISLWHSKKGKERYIVKQDFLHAIKDFSEKNEWQLPDTKLDIFNKLDTYELAYVSAMLEWLCWHYTKNIPSWLLSSGFGLEKPYFPEFATSDKVRVSLMVYSPPEFSRRNIFIGEDSMEVA